MEFYEMEAITDRVYNLIFLLREFMKRYVK